MKKNIVLCADDYGQAPAISQGIVALLRQGRLSAVSCMVNTPYWLEQAKELASFQGQVDVGLHFNLTEGRPLSALYQAHSPSFFSLSGLMGRTFLRRVNREAIEAECHAQINRFEEAMGYLPHFIDGHQHVHQFPVIREAVLAAYQQRLQSQKAYIRWVNEGMQWSDVLFDPKKIIIYATGTPSFGHLLDHYHIPHNLSFAGIYAFNQANQYDQLFPRFLEKIGDGGLIMCHPGLSSSTEDRIAKARELEYAYLSSDRFLRDCERQEVTITRFLCPQPAQ